MKINYSRIITIVIIFIVVFYIYYTYPRRFDKSLNGLEYRLGNEQYQKEVNIKINGWYTRKIFSSDYFQGSIIIGDTNLTKVKIFMQNDKNHLDGISEDASEPISFGNIYTNKGFEELTISVYEDGDRPEVQHWSPSDGLMISSPAENRDSAINLSNKLMQSFWGERINLR